MSSDQQGLFSSVLGFLSREVQDFVTTATGGNTTEVSVRSFATSLTIKISHMCPSIENCCIDKLEPPLKDKVKTSSTALQEGETACER